MSGFFREMFDVMTFYKPIKLVVQEQKSILYSLIIIFIFFFFFSALSIALKAILTFTVDVPSLVDVVSRMLFLLLFLVVHVIFSSLAVFSLSRIIARRGSFTKLLSTNFFLVASATPFLLVIFIPFADFAGLLLFFLGTMIYLIFIYEAIANIFTITTLKTFLLLFLYVLVSIGVYYAFIQISTFLGLPNFGII